MTSRKAFRGPGMWNLDAVVSKTFPLRERLNLEFRAEGFNVFNHHNLFLQEALNDVFNYSPGNNGGANDERRFGQFALKVNF